MTASVNGYIIYEGPSELDGAPIIVIATGFAKPSVNTKTGDMVQTWILRADVEPHLAVKSGHDESVCGQCPLRPMLHVKAPGRKPCYVRTDQGPLTVYRTYHRGRYPQAPIGIFLGRKVRFGSYGDPGAVPTKAWTQARREMAHNTGYTHQWRTAARCHAQFTMASVETPEARAEAKTMGYRTFRTKLASEPLLDGEIACPASKEAGARTTCAKCRLCGGASIKAKDIAINLH